MKVFLYSLLLLFFSVVNSFAGSSLRVDSVQADFVQEKSLPILARPLISQGRFLFQAPGSLRWEYFSPLSSVLLMNNGQVRKFVKHNGVFVEEHGMGDSGLMESVTLYEGENSFTRMIFSNSRLNKPLSDEIFQKP